jgi:hypothetical protein
MRVSALGRVAFNKGFEEKIGWRSKASIIRRAQHALKSNTVPCIATKSKEREEFHSLNFNFTGIQPEKTQ